MRTLVRHFRSAWPFACLFLLAAALCVERAWRCHATQGPEPPPLSEWDAPQLARYLQDRGLELDAVPQGEREATPLRAYLSSKGHTWQQCYQLWKTPNRLAEWQG